MSDPSRPNESKSSVDPSSQFDTAEIRPIKATSPPIIPAPAATDGYELEGGPIPDDDELPKPVPIPIPTRSSERPKGSARPKKKPEFAPPELEEGSEFEDEFSEIEPVWSRWAEWGPDLIRMGSTGLGTLFLAWLLWGHVTPVLPILLLGGAATVLFSYPIMITLERPVRVTPEHAVNDFFDAASHHFPHYRRMWLLVSVEGREASGCTSFESFRAHWKSQIARWKQTKGASALTPLTFKVESFQASKSSGKETSKADYTVVITLRDRDGEGPIESFRMSHGLVRGPDRMWYMNRGVLDRGSK